MTDRARERHPGYDRVFNLALERGYLLRCVAQGLISDLGDAFLLFECPEGAWGPVACWSFDLADIERFLTVDGGPRLRVVSNGGER